MVDSKEVRSSYYTSGRSAVDTESWNENCVGYVICFSKLDSVVIDCHVSLFFVYSIDSN